MFHLSMSTAAYAPIVLAVVAALLAAGAILLFRSETGRARTWGVATLLIGAIATAWAAGRAGDRQPVPVKSAVVQPTAARLPESEEATHLAEVLLDSARTECVQARDHFTRIMLLVRNLKNAEAGVELLATADHLERALQDVGRGPDPRAALVLRQARVSATQLIRNSGPVPVSIGMAVDALGSELDRAAASLAAPRV